jgi:cytidylate kinase
MGVVIAIDGPSGAGKTTIAQSISQELGYVYLDTGALYRAVALALRKSGIDSEAPDKKIDDILRKTVITYENSSVLLHGEHIDDGIRSWRYVQPFGQMCLSERMSECHPVVMCIPYYDRTE